MKYAGCLCAKCNAGVQKHVCSRESMLSFYI